MNEKLQYMLLLLLIVFISVGCQQENAKENLIQKYNITTNSDPNNLSLIKSRESEIIPSGVFDLIVMMLSHRKSRIERAKYEEKYYCYVGEPFFLDLSEPGEEQGNIHYDGMGAPSSIDKITGVIHILLP